MGDQMDFFDFTSFTQVHLIARTGSSVSATKWGLWVIRGLDAFSGWG